MPKLEPGLDGGGGLSGVEVAAIEAGTIIATSTTSHLHHHHHDEDDEQQHTIELVQQGSGHKE